MLNGLPDQMVGAIVVVVENMRKSRVSWRYSLVSTSFHFCVIGQRSTKIGVPYQRYFFEKYHVKSHGVELHSMFLIAINLSV